MEINWIVEKLYCYPQANGNANVVFKVDFFVTAQEDQYKGLINRDINIIVAEGGTFVPYANLTNDIVIGWIKTQLGKQQVILFEDLAIKNLESQKPQDVVINPLPW